MAANRRGCYVWRAKGEEILKKIQRAKDKLAQIINS
jgi:hypothetical protein